jgi:hypothetical protein
VNDLLRVCGWTLDRPTPARCDRLRKFLVGTGYPIKTQWWTDEETIAFAKQQTYGS